MASNQVFRTSKSFLGEKENRSTAKIVHNFDGLVSAHTYGQLIVEIIKYVLYMKEQMALPFDTLKQRLNLSFEKVNGAAGSSTYHHRRGISKFVSDMDQIFCTLQKFFDTKDATKIDEILLMIGSTIITPKEVYSFKVSDLKPHNDENLESLSLQCCMRKMFKALMSSEWTDQMMARNFSGYNIFVFISYSGNVETNLMAYSDNVMPNMRFLKPTKAVNYSINFSCCAKEDFPEDSPAAANFKTSLNVHHREECTSSESATNRYIWYQLLPIVKGIKHKFL